METMIQIYMIYYQWWLTPQVEGGSNFIRKKIHITHQMCFYGWSVSGLL